MGCQDALLGDWIFPMGLQDGRNSNDGNGCLWPLSGPAALGVPSFPPPTVFLSCPSVWLGAERRSGDFSG